MRLVPRVATPAVEAAWPVGLALAKKFCIVEETTEFDAELNLFLSTAFTWLQPPFGVLRLSIAEQTLRLDLPCWPSCSLTLPAGPVQSISSVKYFDESNVDQTLADANYFLDNDELIWADTFNSPAHYERPSAVRITYVTGYAADAPDYPVLIKTAILQCVKHWFDNREAVAAVGAMNMMPLGVDDLLANYRVR